LTVLKECPIKRLDVLGNEFKKKLKVEYRTAFPDAGVLSKF
jgi:hypothetical protein